MTMQTTEETVTLANTSITEKYMSGFTFDGRLLDPPQRPEAREEHRLVVGDHGGYSRMVWYLTTDLYNGNDAQKRAGTFGFDLRILFPCEGLPSAGAALLVALDELLLDAHGRREYLALLLTQKLSIPVVVFGRDFLLDRPTVLWPGLMLASRLDAVVFRAVRDGHIYPLRDEGQRRKAA